MPCSTKPRVDFISTLPEFYAILHSKKRFEDLCSKLTLIDVFGHISCVHNCFQLYYQYFLEKKTFQTTKKFCHFGIPKYFLRGNTENQVFKDSNCRLIQFIIHIYFGITKEVLENLIFCISEQNHILVSQKDEFFCFLFFMFFF